MTRRQYNIVLVFVLFFFMLVLGLVAGMNIKNSNNLRDYLTDSVKSQLISISVAAREVIDVEAFIAYQDASVAELPDYQATLAKLRTLASQVGAKYIYALKRQDGEFVFVYDTDPEDEEIFISYELSPVHDAAFAGRDAADIMNVDDEYGSYNTGAVPIWKNGQVVGIICTDIEDAYLESSYRTATQNSIALITMLLATMVITLIATVKMLNRIRDMQGKLKQQALFDNVTGLPNRQYLMDYLDKMSLRSGAADGKGGANYALFFIDLDNFKSVNDNAGHDAGDEVLRQIANYLDRALENSKSFRPSAGHLNIAARVGGDEFIQVVSGVGEAEKDAELATQLLDGFKKANLSRYIEKYKVGLSIGVALCPYHSDNYHVLIKYADIAMYHAKHGGKNQFRVYNDEMQKNS